MVGGGLVTPVVTGFCVVTGDDEGIPNGVSIPGKNGDVVLSGVVNGVVFTVVVIAMLVVG